MSKVLETYDTVADAYAEAVTPVQEKPFDLQALVRFADVLPAGPVADVGCGPGDVTAWLTRRGLDAVGVDASPGMVAAARGLHPALRFQVGDFLALPPAAYAGITAFYCLIHLARGELASALRRLGEALVPGGALLVALHAGEDEIMLDEWFGRPVELTTRFHSPEALAAALDEAGLETAWLETRPPYPDIEYPSTRIYALAKRPR